MKRIVLFLILALFAIGTFGQPPRTNFDLSNYGVSISPDQRLMAVLVSLEIGGVDTELSPNGKEFRARIRNDFKNLSPDLRQRMRTFVEQYKRRHSKARPAEIVTPFVSLAYSMSDAPALTPPERSLDLPDDLLEVLDFAVLVQELYKSPGSSQILGEYDQKYQQLKDSFRPTAKEMVIDVLDYLHTKPELTYAERVKVKVAGKGKKKPTERTEIRRFDRKFRIVPDYLAPRNAVNFLNIRDEYVVVVSPDTDLSSSDARRAYLQFVLDPLVLKNATAIIAHKDSLKKLLDQRRKAGEAVSPDAVLAVSRSLVAAADIREENFRRENLAVSQARRKIALLKQESEKKSVVAELNRVKKIFADEAALQLSESYKKGAVLAFYFAEKLRGIEDSGFDVANSLEDWIAALNPGNEAGRLEENAEASKRAALERDNRRKNGVIVTTLASNPLTEALIVIDKDIEAKKLSQAERSLNGLLKQYPQGAPRIYYSLGRVASLSAEGLANSTEVNKRLIKAKTFFEKALGFATATTDRELISLTYVSLGRIYEFYDQKEYAVKIYDTAMQFGSTDGEGFKKAFEAKQKLVSKN